jgi:hypothetical protein
VRFGISLLVKPVARPLLLLFAIRRKWHPFTASIAVLALGYIVAFIVLGWATFSVPIRSARAVWVSILETL